MRCLVNKCAASFCCSATCSASVGLACVALHSQYSLRSGPSPRLQSDWKGVHFLRLCSQPWQLRAQGFMLLDSGSIHGLSRSNNALSDRMGRAPSNSFPERSAARFCNFSSHFMALATHMSLSLASHSTTDGNSVLTESLLLINLSVKFFDPELSCSLCCTSCRWPPHASGQSRPHSTQTAPPSP